MDFITEKFTSSTHYETQSLFMILIYTNYYICKNMTMDLWNIDTPRKLAPKILNDSTVVITLTDLCICHFYF